MIFETALIEGYAAIFDAPDASGDVLARGAFARRPQAEEIRMLHQHEAAEPLGRWLDFREDALGLYAVGRLILSSPRAREVWALLRGGAIDGLSIGFQTVRAERSQGRRLITEAALWEVSIVTFPMAAGARILAVGPAESEEVPPRDAPPSRAARDLFAASLVRAARLIDPSHRASA